MAANGGKLVDGALDSQPFCRRWCPPWFCLVTIAAGVEEAARCSIVAFGNLWLLRGCVGNGQGRGGSAAQLFLLEFEDAQCRGACERIAENVELGFAVSHSAQGSPEPAFKRLFKRKVMRAMPQSKDKTTQQQVLVIVVYVLPRPSMPQHMWARRAPRSRRETGATQNHHCVVPAASEGFGQGRRAWPQLAMSAAASTLMTFRFPGRGGPRQAHAAIVGSWPLACR
eukprot:CAMPEP_0117533626 /NCGR_PEP_ID=MMETSP0784-20121206/39990_1 /TAXON_ID=39447 /ORGANISM="" /LENGTH=225 /DNA_ID=CAMNT_0005330075 /DNA_START=101 /DNA_END=777 /DNA_ORIENTATION=-